MLRDFKLVDVDKNHYRTLKVILRNIKERRSMLTMKLADANPPSAPVKVEVVLSQWQHTAPCEVQSS